MGKYEKRRIFRQYRQANVPFLLALSIVKMRKSFSPWFNLKLPEGYVSRTAIVCECCGPTEVIVEHTATGRRWRFDYNTYRVF